MEKIYFLLIRIIDKMITFRKSSRTGSAGSEKNALVSYLRAPGFFLSFYYRLSHNNRYTAWLLVKILQSKGYTVYLYDYLDTAGPDYSLSYDLFLGHNKTFTTIAKKLKGNPAKVLLTTGSSPEFGNQQQVLRNQDVNSRKNASLMVYDDNVVPDLTANFQMADVILTMGNDFVRNTYRQKYHSKMHLINNVTLHPFFIRNQQKRTNNFLFISSIGQVHRGLDLLLDIFKTRPNKLYVLSLFEKEKEFVDVYRKELYETPSIIPAGYVALNSDRFRAIAEDVDFIILPSCSEGQSSSVINMMAYGLIPVIPLNAGVPDPEKIGVCIKTIDLSGVAQAVDEALALRDSEFREKKAHIAAANPLFTGEGFQQRVGGLLNDYAKSPHDA